MSPVQIADLWLGTARLSRFDGRSVYQDLYIYASDSEYGAHIRYQMGTNLLVHNPKREGRATPN